jgi:VanZ family protein
MFLRHNTVGILWALFILALCGLPGGGFPDLSFWRLLTFDKFAHAFVFAVLVVLLIVGFKKQRTFPVLRYIAVKAAMAFSLIYGALVELLQKLIFIDRTGDLIDFIANSLGCFIGLLAFYLIYGKEVK